MREIKFRAWNQKCNRWAICEEFGYIRINPTIDECGGGSIGADLQDMTSVYKGTGDLILMQYIGLKDKNGKEIYEGELNSDYLRNSQAEPCA